MRKDFFIAAALLAAMLMTGCGDDTDDSSAIDVSAGSTVSETTAEAEETSETTGITTEKNKSETDDTTEITETETAAQTSETAETNEESESSTVSETLSAEELAAVMKIIEENSKTVGSSAAGYITVYSGSGYEEDEYGDYIVTSEDGATQICVMFYDDLQTNLDQTAYMFCMTAVMNAEIDGFETYNMVEISIDGMEGYFAVMIDDDEGTGFKLYASLADQENGILRTMSCESTDYTQENVIASSVVFDSYRRADI